MALKRDVHTVTRPLASLVLACLCTAPAGADDDRARVNYVIHCQGCHLPGAVGVPGKVPSMKDFLGFFLHSEEGREFVIRVPGVATSSLSNEELTELVNWILTTYSGEQLPKRFRPYAVDEVAAQRLNLEPDPVNRRIGILERIAAERPEVAAGLEAHGY